MTCRGGPLAQQPFQPLSLLMKHLGYADGSAHLESALTSAWQIERQVVLNQGQALSARTLPSLRASQTGN